MIDVERALQQQIQRLDLIADEGVDPGQLFGEIGVGLEFPGQGPSPFVVVQDRVRPPSTTMVSPTM